MQVFENGKEVSLPIHKRYGLGPLRLVMEIDFAEAYNRVIIAQVIAKTSFETIRGFPWQHGFDMRPYLCVTHQDERKFRRCKFFIEEACAAYQGIRVEYSQLEDLILIAEDDFREDW